MGLFDIFKKKDDNIANEYTPSVIAKKIAEIIDCPHEFYAPTSDIQTLMDIYEYEYKKGKDNGYIPVWIVPSDTLLETLEMNIEDGQTVDDTNIDGKRFLNLRTSEYGHDGDFPVDRSVYDDWGGDYKTLVFSGWDDFDKKGMTVELILVKIPVSNPWEVIKKVQIGGWNDCPVSEEIMAVLRYWYNEHGAVPALISSDVLEMYLPRPVNDREKAIILAEEHFGFCSDIIFQGVEELNILAQYINNSNIWYFWWD